MKKIILMLVLCFSIFCNTGCAFIIWELLTDTSVSEKTNDPQKYGDFHDEVKVPSYYPTTLSDYTVNYYSYSIESDLKLGYEIFLDITVSESAFTEIISRVLSVDQEKTVKDAYHSTKYKDVIFHNEFEYLFDGYEDLDKAYIEKVIYNESDKRIIFALLYVEPYSDFEISDVEYFKRLNIDPAKYNVSNNNEF